MASLILRRCAPILAAALILAWTAPRLWRSEVDGFRTSWEAVATGAEWIAPWSAFTVWDGRAETVAPQSAVPLLLAHAGGAEHGEASYALLLLSLALGWAAGGRRLGRDLGLAEPAAAALGLAAAWIALHAAGGRVALLAAVPMLWLISAALRAEGVSLLAPLLALAALSRPGLLLAFPAAVVAALSSMPAKGRANHSLAALVGLAIFLLLPESPVCHHIRASAPYYFSDGPYRLPTRSFTEALALPLGGGFGAATGTVVLGFAAVIASVVGSRRERTLLAIVVLLLMLGAGSTSTGTHDLPLVDLPMRFFAFVIPSLRFQSSTELAALLAAPCLLALALRAGRSPTHQGVVIAAAVLPLFLAGKPSAPPAPPDPSLVHAVAAVDGRVLALPLSVANDLRWRRALPGNPRLENGLQVLVRRGAPVLASELRHAGPAALQRWLQMLGIDHAVVPDAEAAAIGRIIASGAGESLVRVAPPERVAKGPCLPTAVWHVRSSVGNPEVSVPERAIDHDPATRWGTGAPQRPGQFFEVDLGAVHRLERLEIRTGSFETDYPRGFRVLASSGGSAWRPVVERSPYLGEAIWNGDFAYFDGGRSGKVEVPLEGIRARALRVELLRGAEPFDWSISEVCVAGGPPEPSGEE